MKMLDAIIIIIQSIYEQVLNCLRYDLHCMDPPIITSGLLDKYGIDKYPKKLSFWKIIDYIISRYNEVVIFRSRFGLFKLYLSHDIEEIYRIENSDIYVDALDCNYIKCTMVPRSHVLRIYLEGMYNERVVLRINIVTLLKLAIVENPYFRECLEDFVSDPMSLTSIMKIVNCSTSIIMKHKNIYNLLFNKHLKTALDVIKYSPLLRKYIEFNGQSIKEDEKSSSQ
ncbi:MAG: hypothetical protein QXD57_03055 [Ignisphaera sp.]